MRVTKRLFALFLCLLLPLLACGQITDIRIDESAVCRRTRTVLLARGNAASEARDLRPESLEKRPDRPASAISRHAPLFAAASFGCPSFSLNKHTAPRSEQQWNAALTDARPYIGRAPPHIVVC